MIGRQRWDWFATLTFKPKHQQDSGGVHPERADKAFRFFVSVLNREAFGRHWWKPGRPSTVWVRGQEFHKNGRIHFHALLAGSDRNLNECASRYAWHEWWYREFGRNRIEVPANGEQVNGYVSKYSAKGGEVDFSANFGTVHVEPLDFDFSGCPVPYNKTGPGESGKPRGRGKNQDPAVQGLSLTLPVRFFSGASGPEN
jgi:hypothetical protein